MQNNRASWWSITINNPTQQDREAIMQSNWPTFVKGLKAQDEVGSDGTLHIQGALNTAQVRFAQVKNWLQRAHIEIARDKSALLRYVEKPDTAVDGTQFNATREYLTMHKALLELVDHYVEMTEEEMKTLKYDTEEIRKEEYWAAVNRLLMLKPDLVQLYTNPQMLRAWVHTKNVWVEHRNAQDR